jgi:hypothetical protein
LSAKEADNSTTPDAWQVTKRANIESACVTTAHPFEPGHLPLRLSQLLLGTVDSLQVWLLGVTNSLWANRSAPVQGWHSFKVGRCHANVFERSRGRGHCMHHGLISSQGPDTLSATATLSQQVSCCPDTAIAASACRTNELPLACKRQFQLVLQPLIAAADRFHLSVQPLTNSPLFLATEATARSCSHLPETCQPCAGSHQGARVRAHSQWQLCHLYSGTPV